MCFFQQPSAPQIVYQGPSETDVAASKASLEKFRADMATQMQTFNDAIQKQIDDANIKAADTRSKIEQERAAALAEMGAQQQGAYATAVETVTPEDAQVTETIKPKEKSKASLKIGSGTTTLSQGAGLNIGV